MRKAIALLTIALALMFLAPAQEAKAATIHVGVDISWQGQTVCGFEDFSNFCGTFTGEGSQGDIDNCQNAAWGWIEQWWANFLHYALNVLGLGVHFSCH